jgi:hypothetical protein
MSRPEAQQIGLPITVAQLAAPMQQQLKGCIGLRST